MLLTPWRWGYTEPSSGHDISPEQTPGTPKGESPSINLIGIAPHQITHGSILGNFLLPVDNAYLIQCVDAWTESPVHGEYLIEYFRAVSPEVDAPKFPQTFVVEAVYLCDFSAFVIASDEDDAIGISDFSCEE